jgi:hypothetical protein
MGYPILFTFQLCSHRWHSISPPSSSVQKLNRWPLFAPSTARDVGFADPIDGHERDVSILLVIWLGLPLYPRGFDNWFDPIEAGLRGRAREFLQVMLEGELDEALARSRYVRRAKDPSGDPEEPAGVTGQRHGHRPRPLLGTFGKVEIEVPRARLNTPDGKTTEWTSWAGLVGGNSPGQIAGWTATFWLDHIARTPLSIRLSEGVARPPTHGSAAPLRAPSHLARCARYRDTGVGLSHFGIGGSGWRSLAPT